MLMELSEVNDANTNIISTNPNRPLHTSRYIIMARRIMLHTCHGAAVSQPAGEMQGPPCREPATPSSRDRAAAAWPRMDCDDD
jgi:hypothetical protein